MPAARFATPAQFAEALKHAEIMPAAVQATSATQRTGARAVPRGVRRYVAATPVLWIALAATAAVGAYGWMGRAKPPAQPLIVVSLMDAGGVSAQSLGGGVSISLSRDGSQLACVGSDSTRIQRLFVRSLSNGSVTAVPKSEFGRAPVFSPDGHSLAFFHDGHIVVWTIGTGTVRSLAEGDFPRGMSWSPDSTIIYSAQGKLMRVLFTITGRQGAEELGSAGF